MTKEKLSSIIKKVNKENEPPGGWKKEDVIKVSGSGPAPCNTIIEQSAHDMTDKEVAASVDLEVSDFSDDGSDIDELRDILDGNT